MVDVSLLEFFRHGCFGPVCIGATRDEILNLLGEPDNCSVVRRKHHKPDILKYGDFEFHFAVPEDQVFLIYADDFTGAGGVPNNGNRLCVDSWIVRAGLPRSEFERAALDADLLCELNASPDPDSICLCVGARAQIAFIENEKSGYSSPGLWAFYKR